MQEVVRVLRKAGAKADSEVTSQHIHIGVEGFTARQIANLARIYYKQEALLLKAAGTHDSRLRRYTKPTDREFIARLEAAKPDTKEELNKASFGYANPNPEHYDSARYRSLNLNNVWRMGTVEFRLFNGVDHAGVAKSHIHLCLALAAKALTAKCASTIMYPGFSSINVTPSILGNAAEVDLTPGSGSSKLALFPSSSSSVTIPTSAERP